MRRRTAEPSLEELSSVIEDIYGAGVDGAGWIAMLRRIGDLLGGLRTTVWMQDAAERFQFVESAQQEHLPGYAEHFGQLDALRPAVVRAPTGTVMTNRMVVPVPEFVRTEFYNDYANPYDMHDAMMARVLEGSSASAYIGVARSPRGGFFESRDTRLLSLVLPHLSRAMRTRLSLASASIGPDCALELLDRVVQGVLIVDAEARVAHANRVAETMLAKGDALAIDQSGGGRLRMAGADQTRALRRLIGQAATPRGEALARGGVLRFTFTTGVSLLASVTPLRATVAWNAARRPAALVLLGRVDQDAPPAPAHLRALFDLTPAEAAVAGRIMQGDGVKAAARALGIAPTTLRTHLSRVFAKTETRRQAELVRLLQQVARLE